MGLPIVLDDIQPKYNAVGVCDLYRTQESFRGGVYCGPHCPAPAEIFIPAYPVIHGFV